MVRDDVDVDQFIDVIEGNRHYIKSLIVVNKMDLLREQQIAALKKRLPSALFVSAEHKTNIEELKDALFNKLDFIRVYTKDPGKAPDMKEPMIMLRSSTVKDFCNKLHRDFVNKFKYVRIWGSSAKFPGQKQMLKHILVDKDIVEVHVR